MVRLRRYMALVTYRFPAITFHCVSLKHKHYEKCLSCFSSAMMLLRSNLTVQLNTWVTDVNEKRRAAASKVPSGYTPFLDKFLVSNYDTPNAC